MKINNEIVKNILIMTAISFAIIIVVSLSLGFYTRHNEEVTIPNIRGMKVDKAIDKLSTSDLQYEIVDSVYRNDIDHGVVIETSPKEGANVKVGRKIYITINSFAPMHRKIPRIENMSSRQAIAQLNSLKFYNIKVKEVVGDFDNLCIRIETQDGKIVPTGKDLSVDTPLVLVVSKIPSDESYYQTQGEEEKKVDDEWL